MLVEINLLTEKRKKDMTYYFIAAVVAFILIVSILALRLVNDQVQSDIDELKAERTSVTDEIAIIQQQLEVKPISHYDLLKTVVEKTEQRVIPASNLLSELVRLLPEHGYMLNFDFYHPDVVTFNVRFDQISSIAAYSFALDESPFITDVTLSSVNTQFFELNLEEDVLPRYEAYFQLVVNRAAFHVKEDE